MRDHVAEAEAAAATRKGWQTGFQGKLFFSVADIPRCCRAITELYASLSGAGRFASDNLLVWGRALSFLDDDAFMAAYNRNARDDVEKGIIWRSHTLAWAARQALRLEGDLVECGVYRGYSARLISDLIEAEVGDRRFWLYDAFGWKDGDAHAKLEHHDTDLLAETRARLADAPFAWIVPGYIPESFADGAPEQVAFLHLDLNNAEAEAAALAFFWDRLVPGAFVIFDDFGWTGYTPQRLAHEAFAEAKGHRILELPTGQGLLIKTP